MNGKQGEIFIEVRDEKTLELKHTVSAKNVMSLALFYNDMERLDNNHSWNASNVYGNGPTAIAVSGRTIKNGNKTLCWRGRGHASYPTGTSYPATDYTIRQEDVTVHGWQYTEGAIPFLERKARFNSPATLQTINSIYLTGSGANGQEFVATSIGLNTPCLHNPGEVLDITYRIQFYDSISINAEGSWTSPTIYKDGYVATRRYAGSYSGFPMYTYGSFLKVPDSSPYNELKAFALDTANNRLKNWIDGGSPDDDAIFSYDHFKVIYRTKFDKEHSIGEIMSSVHIGGNDTTQFFTYYENNPSDRLEVQPSALMSVPFFPENPAYKPIQPIQNHSKDAPEWGLDVDFLASCQGTISVNGDNWENADWPEFWRVEFSKTGDVGTSNYFFRNRRLLGFVDNNYKLTYRYRVADLVSTDIDHKYETHFREHGAHTTHTNHEYDADSYISWDDTGINIHVMNKPLIIAYDATTTPALPVLTIRQVAVADNGDIWIACTSTGLYRITSPLDPASATITLMSEATNGLSVGTDGTCQGVAIGWGGSVWAVMDGALSHSTNPTDATPTFSNYNSVTGTAFDYSAIITNPWSDIKYIKVNRNSIDNELAVMFVNGNNEKIIWWSLAGIAYDGPESSDLSDATYLQLDHTKRIGLVDVSRYGSLWARLGPNLYDQVQQLQWSLSTTDDLSLRVCDPLSQIQFYHDYYNVPYIGNQGYMYAGINSSTTSYDGNVLLSIDEAVFSRVLGSPHTTSSSTAHGFAWQNKRASGMFVGNHSSYNSSTDSYRRGQYPEFIAHMAPDGDSAYMDSLNGQHSPFEEICWDKYHWNGSAWELNYYAPAIDSSTGTNYPAVRHNFDTESHYFTGRSMIDASAAFDTNNFASNATFVFSIQPNQKQDSTETGNPYSRFRAKRQDFPITLFDFSTKTRRCKLVLQSTSSSSPTISFVEDDTATTLSTSPITMLTNGSYRVAVIIDATTAKVYIDGVQLGSTVSLISAFDFSNVSGDMLAYIGCRVYSQTHIQRNTPWPTEFFRGEMTNVQLWNVAWTSTDVANDFANPATFINSQSAANMIARYELTQSLEGLETKPTHTSQDAMVDGLTISFANGANPDAFVATDYYTFGVVDGILKDNSISFTRESSVYHKPVDHEFTQFVNESGTSAVIEAGTNTVQVTETAKFKGNLQMNNDSYLGTESYDIAVIDQYPGHLYKGKFDAFTTNYTYQYMDGGYTHQFLSGDGYFECSPAAADLHMMFGFSTDTQTGIDNSAMGTFLQGIQYAFAVTPAGDVDIYENGSLVANNVTTYTIDSIFRVRKVGPVVSYHIENNGTETLLHTSSVASTGNLYGVAAFPYGGMGIVDVNINYTRFNNLLTIGDPVALTGSFDPKFLRVDSIDVTSYAFKIDSVDAVVLAPRNETYEDLPSPGIGEVVLDGKTGWLIFNDVDIGKTVTGHVTVIYDDD